MKTLSVAPAGTRQSVADVVVATGGGQPSRSPGPSVLEKEVQYSTLPVRS